MTQAPLEERLARTLAEVASRIVKDDPPPLVMRASAQGATRRRRRVALASAAAAAGVLVVVAVGVGMTVRSDDRDEVPVATVGSRAVLTTDIGSETITVQTVEPGDTSCVELQLNVGSGSNRPACLRGRPVALSYATRGGTTLVYGIAARAERFSAHTGEDPPTVHEAKVGEGAAFLLVIDGLNVSGTVEALDPAGKVLASTDFRHSGSREAKGTIGAARILTAYKQAGAIWALTTDGSRVRLSDGTLKHADGSPHVAPDGYTVLYTVPGESNFDEQVALDARDGTTRALTGYGRSFSSDGRFVAGSIPIDDDVDVPVVVLDGASFAEVARVGLGRATQIGMDHVSGLAWDVGDHGLLAVGAKGVGLWWLDPFGGTASRLAVGGDELSHWVVSERAVEPGVFPTVRRQESSVDWGYLRIAGAGATYERRGTMPTTAGDMTLNAKRISFMEPISMPPGANEGGLPTLRDDTEPAYLIGDGHNAFKLTARGELTLVVRDAAAASAP